ncbi:trehalase-domain-containing protein [Polychytrium aggregatum]|uniref:trehalase-domain-containing protein n=1 Tax=Polychytrium aggregatum TaxID=110093 RepID=UPI0022FDFB0E|nr:trehalase-domain-containing protein [Polychytrium aggregatum]KAI9205781.1 trehalase-domain-containing protein [Polychytrium aggregatum]
MRRRRGSFDDKAPGKPRKFLLDVEETQRLLLEQEDTDRDYQITIHDSGPKTFPVGTANSGGFKKYEIRGTYMLSNLLQELAIAADYGRKFVIIDEDRLSENPVDRLTRLIKYHFWDGLTRRIDADGLETICADPKNRSRDRRNRIFVPYHDDLALYYYTKVSKDRPHLQLDVVRLPEIITPEYVKTLNNHPGILSLALRQTFDPRTKTATIRGTPFVVPGGRFNEMYGWDSYFEALGLLVDGRTELARGMVENFCYEIEHYGKILNANRSYYLTRSQPPFLTDMILTVYQSLRVKPEWDALRLKEWLGNGVRAAIKELFSVWMAPPRLDEETGLVRYYPEGIGMPPETESSHFDHVLKPFMEKYGGEDLDAFKKMYNSGQVKDPVLDEYFIHDRAVRESGHDTTYRFEGKCASLATVDLNSLIYKYEVDLAEIIETHFGGSRAVRGSEFVEVTVSAQLFAQMAKRTQHQINKYLWNSSKKMYFDWDCKDQQQTTYESCTTFWALWSGVASQHQAKAMVPVALEIFEAVGGLVSGTEESRGKIGLTRPNRQWDFPFGWAPHQIMAWVGLRKYGFMPEARRIAYRWLYTITKSFVDFNGVVPEKFDVVTMTHKVNVEYGNVGSDFKYVVREGFGWMNASYQIGQTYLTKNMKRALGALIPPDELFLRSGADVKSQLTAWERRNSFEGLSRVISAHSQKDSSNSNCSIQ